MVVQWPIALEEILAGDQVVGLASVTPAKGVVIAPMTNFALHERQSGTVRVNSSVGAGKKLDRVRRDPRVALAFHTRDQGTADGPEYVLVQGIATVASPVENFPATIGGRWDDKEGPRAHGLWGRWLRVYYTRVPIDIAVQRIIVWPDLNASGEPLIVGAPLGKPPPSQKPPAGGTDARVDSARTASAATRLPHVLLGWVGDDGLPMIVPVAAIEGVDDRTVRLRAAGSVLPPGQRRAGLTAHAFSRHVRGEHQRLYTGWLEVDADGRTATYRPHTGFGFHLPPSKLLYHLAVGFSARRGVRGVLGHPG